MYNKLFLITIFLTFDMIRSLSSKKINNSNNLCYLDETEMNEFYSKNKRLFIRATYPGSGKSYGVYQFMKNKNSILTILPINTTCRDVRKRGFDAITFHRFFSLDVSGRAIKHKHVLNLDQYECIFFDEVAR